MTKGWRTIPAAAALMLLAGCQTANDAADIPLSAVLDPAVSGRIAVVVEDTDNLPARSANDATGGVLYQVDLAKKHYIMVGLNPSYLANFRVDDGDLVKGRFSDAAPATRYNIAAAPAGAVDVTLPIYYRNDGRLLENKCYYENAIVYRLKPGVINYIPKELQLPLYDLRRFEVQPAHPDTGDLHRVLARFPLGHMDIAMPDVVAIVKFAPDKLDPSACQYNYDFTILKQR
jgi:hypothetical protein